MKTLQKSFDHSSCVTQASLLSEAVKLNLVAFMVGITIASNLEGRRQELVGFPFRAHHAKEELAFGSRYGILWWTLEQRSIGYQEQQYDQNCHA